MLMDLVDHVVGVDPDRDRITAAVVSAKTQGELAWRTFPATARGYRAVQRWAGEFTETGRRAWAIEGSGSFGAGLATALAANEEYVIEFDHPRSRAATDGAKSDALDAVRAARETLGRAAWSSPRARGAREGLRTLIVAWESAKIARVAAINILKALIVTAPEDDRAMLRAIQTVARHRDPLRQTRHHLPRRSRPESDHNLAEGLRRHALGLLLEQPYPFSRLTQLGGLLLRDAGLHPLFDIGFLQPVRQTRLTRFRSPSRSDSTGLRACQRP